MTGQKGIAGFEGATCLRSLVLNFVGNGSAILIRREALEDVGGYTTALTNSADWHLQVMISRRWKVGCVPEFLTEGPRLLRKAISRLRPMAPGNTPGPLFSEIDPAVPFGDPDVLVLRWLVERVAPLEVRFIVEEPTARAAGPAPQTSPLTAEAATSL